MALYGGRGGGGRRSRVVLVLLLLLMPLLATPPPCARARELLGGDRPAGGVENDDREAPAGRTTTPLVRGLPPAFGGRTVSGRLGSAVAVAARMLGSVPSHGVGH